MTTLAELTKAAAVRAAAAALVEPEEIIEDAEPGNEKSDIYAKRVSDAETIKAGGPEAFAVISRLLLGDITDSQG